MSVKTISVKIEAYERLRSAFVEVLADDRLEGSGWLAEAEGIVVTAARASGSRDLRVILRHILPNALAPIFVWATLSVAGAILVGQAIGAGAKDEVPRIVKMTFATAGVTNWRLSYISMCVAPLTTKTSFGSLAWS